MEIILNIFGTPQRDLKNIIESHIGNGPRIANEKETLIDIKNLSPVKKNS